MPLLHGNQRVVASVQYEEGGRFGGYVVHGDAAINDCRFVKCGCLTTQSLEQRQHHRMHCVLETGEVISAVERHGRLYLGVGIFESWLGTVDRFRRQRRQRRQMAAGRTTGNGDEVGVAAVLGDVRLDPREGALYVDDVIGPGVARRRAGS